MGLRRGKPLIVFSISTSDLINVIQSLAQERLTQKQRKIILYVRDSVERVPVTPLVQRLVEVLDCSETAVWNNLKQLKNSGIIMYGDSSTKGLPVLLTPIGLLITQSKKGRVVLLK